VTTGSDGALWIADQSNEGTDRVTTSGVITAYPFTGTPQGITADPYDGTLLIADNTSGGIWQLTVGGSYTILPASPSGTPSEVVWVPVGTSSGFAWVAETNYIGAYNIGGATFNETAVPGSNSSNGIAYGKDGNVWFTASGGPSPFVGVINPTTGAPYSITQIALAPSAVPFGITAGADNAMWYVDRGTNSIGEITLSGHTVTTYPIPTANALPQEIVTGPDGSLWFTENGTGKLGHLIP